MYPLISTADRSRWPWSALASRPEVRRTSPRRQDVQWPEGVCRVDPVVAKRHGLLSWEEHRGRYRRKGTPAGRSAVATRFPWCSTTTSRPLRWSADSGSASRSPGRQSSSWTTTTCSTATPLISLAISETLSRSCHISSIAFSPASENARPSHREATDSEVMSPIKRTIRAAAILNILNSNMENEEDLRQTLEKKKRNNGNKTIQKIYNIQNYKWRLCELTFINFRTIIVVRGYQFMF